MGEGDGGLHFHIKKKGGAWKPTPISPPEQNAPGGHCCARGRRFRLHHPPSSSSWKYQRLASGSAIGPGRLDGRGCSPLYWSLSRSKHVCPSGEDGRRRSCPQGRWWWLHRRSRLPSHSRSFLGWRKNVAAENKNRNKDVSKQTWKNQTESNKCSVVLQSYIFPIPLDRESSPVESPDGRFHESGSGVFWESWRRERRRSSVVFRVCEFSLFASWKYLYSCGKVVSAVVKV